MNRRAVRLVVAVVLLGSLILAGLQPSKAQSPEPQFGGAALELSRSGKVGGYALSEPPGYPGARCQYDATGNGGEGSVFLRYITKPTVTSHPDYPGGQIVTVTSKLYQKLANGTLQFIASSALMATSATSDPTPISPLGLLHNAGPTYILAYEFTWLNPTTSLPEGTIEVAYTSYRPSILDPLQVFPNTPVCASLFPPHASVSSTSGTVNSSLNYAIYRYPLGVTVQVRWDGTSIGTTHTFATATGVGSLHIPASPKGVHKLSFTYGSWSSSVNYTIKPRIKLIPDTVARGSTVNVSLRGFAAHESVRIRWKKGSSWVQVGQVTTSNTGSANVNVVVPSYVPDGLTSVRGDGATSAAQTNAVTVTGGPFVPATLKTPTPTATPSPMATPTVAAPQPSATATNTPAVQPTIEATAPATISTETPTPEPTQAPDASPVAETP
jgi:hypothetical protein